MTSANSPDNCPILELTADGVAVGRCWYYLGGSFTCPRHGDVREAVQRLPILTDELVHRNSREVKGTKE